MARGTGGLYYAELCHGRMSTTTNRSIAEMTEMESNKLDNMPLPEHSHIAVLIPCYNESLTVGKVIDDFKAVLPNADIYV